MKPRILLSLLAIGLFFSCGSATDEPAADLLYRRWQLVEQTPRNGQPEAVFNGAITEFRPDGTVRYTGEMLLCCQPVKVNRNQQTLEAVETYGGPGCETVKCAAAKFLHILRLTGDELVLEFYFEGSPSLRYTNRYKAVR